MADENPHFRRERNLSCRNFARTSSGSSFSSRRISTDSVASVESTTSLSVPSEKSFGQKSLTKIEQGQILELNNSRDETPKVDASQLETSSSCSSSIIEENPEPFSNSVKQLRLHFESLQPCDRILFKTGKFLSTSQPSLPNYHSHPNLNQVIPTQSIVAEGTVTSSLNTSIYEVASEKGEEVDEYSDFDDDDEGESADYEVPEVAHEAQENEPLQPASIEIRQSEGDVPEITIDDFRTVEHVRQPTTDENARSNSGAIQNHSNGSDSQRAKLRADFPRNYRSKTRPKTELVETVNRPALGKYHSYQHRDTHNGLIASVADQDEEIVLREKCDKFIHPILEELITTEETYVENLMKGIQNYGNIFGRMDLPVGLRGKKYVLLGNIEQIAEFHRDEFLPMLHRNRDDVKRLFDEFSIFIEENCFYGYVIFTMNKKKSLKLCEMHKQYFKLIQNEIDDKLGINSFLVQPIQRMARYPLLLQQFITTLFKNRDFVLKPLIESCCRLEKKIRTLLTTTNESEVINDIVECHEFNVFYQGKFRKVSDFYTFDHSLKRGYRSKVFIFDKCMIYTEIKEKRLVFRGCYPCEKIGIVAKTKSFTLFYQKRKIQECDFSGDAALIEAWLELIRNMISSFVEEERLKLKEKYSRENDHVHRRPQSLSPFRNSNRFSSDSGIGNMWTCPKPEAELRSDSESTNRTTWYATS